MLSLPIVTAPASSLVAVQYLLFMNIFFVPLLCLMIFYGFADYSLHTSAIFGFMSLVVVLISYIYFFKNTDLKKYTITSNDISITTASIWPWLAGATQSTPLKQFSSVRVGSPRSLRSQIIELMLENPAARTHLTCKVRTTLDHETFLQELSQLCNLPISPENNFGAIVMEANAQDHYLNRMIQRTVIGCIGMLVLCLSPLIIARSNPEQAPIDFYATLAWPVWLLMMVPILTLLAIFLFNPKSARIRSMIFSKTMAKASYFSLLPFVAGGEQAMPATAIAEIKFLPAAAGYKHPTVLVRDTKKKLIGKIGLASADEAKKMIEHFTKQLPYQVTI